MKKQSFNSYSVLQFYLSISLLVGLLSYVLITSLGNNDRDFVQEEVNIIASQLVQLESGSQSKKNNRKPASTQSVASLSQGQLGLDPWGQAYQYIVLESEGERAKRVLVWSLGPDKRDDLKLHARQWIKEEVGRPPGLSEQADDIYVLKNIEKL